MPRLYHSFMRNVAIVITLTALSGCRGSRFCAPPGPMKQQQANAIVHDPFCQNDIGPYEAASRPPSYQDPLPEPVRNRIVPDQMPWLSQ